MLPGPVRVGTQYENLVILAWEGKDKRPRFIPRMPLASVEAVAQPRISGGVVWEGEKVSFSLTRLPSA